MIISIQNLTPCILSSSKFRKCSLQICNGILFEKRCTKDLVICNVRKYFLFLCFWGSRTAQHCERRTPSFNVMHGGQFTFGFADGIGIRGGWDRQRGIDTEEMIIECLIWHNIQYCFNTTWYLFIRWMFRWMLIFNWSKWLSQFKCTRDRESHIMRFLFSFLFSSLNCWVVTMI